MTDFDRAMKDPAACFGQPSEILDQRNLTREQKLRILHQWEYDVLQREVATEENMPPSEPSHPRLMEIRQALEALGDSGDPHTGGTKFG